MGPIQTKHLRFGLPIRRRGAALIYMTVVFAALTGFVSFGVDIGRVQLTKTELQRASDAAARYGAFGLANVLFGESAAKSNAVLAAGDNTADGSKVVLDPDQDIDLVIWKKAAKKFTVTTDPTLANAVRVRARRLASRGTAVQLMFGKILGIKSCDVTTESIALYTPGDSMTYTVPATRNPFLAGATAGTAASLNNPHNNPDYAGTSSNPRQSPIECTIEVAAGSSMTFDGVNGNAMNDITSTDRYTADGNTNGICNNTNGSEHGISDINAPINCLVGVYLSDDVPDKNTAPAKLDFSTQASRDFTTLQPKLQQMFFIGDGRTSSGEVQQFKVPSGATRLFVGTWDAYEWNNNVGSFQLTIHASGSVTLVK